MRPVVNKPVLSAIVELIKFILISPTTKPKGSPIDIADP